MTRRITLEQAAHFTAALGITHGEISERADHLEFSLSGWSVAQFLGHLGEWAEVWGVPTRHLDVGAEREAGLLTVRLYFDAPGMRAAA